MGGASGSMRGAAAMVFDPTVAAHETMIPHRGMGGQPAASVGAVVPGWPVVTWSPWPDSNGHLPITAHGLEVPRRYRGERSEAPVYVSNGTTLMALLGRRRALRLFCRKADALDVILEPLLAHREQTLAIGHQIDAGQLRPELAGREGRPVLQADDRAGFIEVEVGHGGRGHCTVSPQRLPNPCSIRPS
nr:hypothetical protein SHINE37_40901 [Rhizobiaceae bacterium]